MKTKKESRLRRAKKTRLKINELGGHRLTVHRTPRHIYAQVIDDADGKTLAHASSVDKELREKLKHGANIDAAQAINASM